jgi:VanZ family protein
MTLSHQQKITSVLLAIYWPVLFICAHIAVPKVVREADVSDKSLHFLAYLILVFLLWFTVSDGKKVKWRRALPWWVFLTMVAYGIIDEWLQSYVVGRSCDAWDILADLTSTITGLVLFSVLSFWPAGLVVTAITIFGVANISQADLTDVMPAANATFHLFAYAILTTFWIQCLRLFMRRNSLRPNRVKWLAAALAIPTALALIVELFSVILGKEFAVRDMIISVGAIVAVVVTIHLAGLSHEVEESRD